LSAGLGTQVELEKTMRSSNDTFSLSEERLHRIRGGMSGTSKGKTNQEDERLGRAKVGVGRVLPKEVDDRSRSVTHSSSL
jgi:hypothetical protein